MNFLIRQKLLLMVRALYFCMEEQWAVLGNTFDISPAQQHILFLLNTNHNTLSPSEISRLGCWHQSTVTRLLKPLQDRQLVKVETDAQRPRYKKVTITKAGEALLLQIASKVKEESNFPFEMDHLCEEEINNFLKCGQSILHVHKGELFNHQVLKARMKGIDYA